MPDPHYTILVSADECAEIDAQDWIREATVEEIAATKESNPRIAFDTIQIDQTGRPYFWRTISEAPAHIMSRAAASLRVFRFG